MIETLARKRMQVGALAALAGLLVALFAVFQMASAAPAVVISLNDSDNVVKAGAGYEVHVRVLDGTDATGSTDFELEYIVVSGGVFLTGETAGEALEATTTTADAEATLVVPASAEGVYTITAGILDDNGGPGGTALRMVGSLEVTVGEVGIPVSAVEVVLGNVAHSTAADAVLDKDSKPAGADAAETRIAVTVNILNSLGNKPNAGEISQVILFTPTGNAGEGAAAADTPNSDSVSGDAATASNNFSVNRATPGTVKVTALAIGTDGSSASSGELVLTFTGTATTLVLGDPSGPLPINTVAGDSTADPPVAATTITVDVTATDDAGNKAALPVANLADAAVTFVDADDKAASGITGATTQKPAPTTADANATDPNSVRITVTTVDAKPGSYTMKVAFGTGGAGSAETTIVVADKPANLELTSEQPEGSSIITVTATVTDEDGNLVPNIHTVDFVNVGSLNLVALDDDDPATTAPGSQRATKSGAASVRYVITGGSGSATIIATVAAGVDSVLVISGPEVEEEVVEEEPEVISASNCLSSLQQGYATWTCEGDGQASSIFSELQSRGATSLFLWNGSSWARYSVVDGAEVPGSTDFAITGNDIVYISY